MTTDSIFRHPRSAVGTDRVDAIFIPLIFSVHRLPTTLRTVAAIVTILPMRSNPPPMHHRGENLNHIISVHDMNRSYFAVLIGNSMQSSTWDYIGWLNLENCRFELLTIQINVWGIILDVKNCVYGILPLDILSHI